MGLRYGFGVSSAHLSENRSFSSKGNNAVCWFIIYLSSLIFTVRLRSVYARPHAVLADPMDARARCCN